MRFSSLASNGLSYRTFIGIEVQHYNNVFIILQNLLYVDESVEDIISHLWIPSAKSNYFIP